jgi:hypothetical protein
MVKIIVGVVFLLIAAFLLYGVWNKIKEIAEW